MDGGRSLLPRGQECENYVHLISFVPMNKPTQIPSPRGEVSTASFTFVAWPRIVSRPRTSYLSCDVVVVIAVDSKLSRDILPQPSSPVQRNFRCP